MNKKLLRFLAVGMLFILVLGCFGCSGGGGQQEPAGEEGEEGGEEVALKSEYKLTMNVSTDTCWGQGGLSLPSWSMSTPTAK
jgi:hypothetical protein